MNKRKVIGWTDDFGKFAEVEENFEVYFDALEEDIKEHGYYFVGADLSLSPVFDNYASLDVKERDWAHLMASVYGGNAYEYFETEDLKGEEKLPQEGLYKVTNNVLNVEERAFKDIKDKVINFAYNKDSLKYGGAFFLLPIKSDDTNMYWPDSDISLVCGYEIIQTKVAFVLFLKDKKRVYDLIDGLSYYDSDFTSVVYYPSDIYRELDDEGMKILVFHVTKK